MTQLVIEPRDAQRSYVEVAGILEEIFAAQGERVEPGQPLARLRNPDLALQLVQLRGQRERTEQHLQSLHRRRSDQDAVQQIPHTREALRSLDEQLQELRQDQRRLTVVSGSSGTVMPPPQIPTTTPDRGAFSQWPGTPLEPRNLNRWLEPGTLLCLVGDPQQMQATLVIDQSQMEFIRVGQAVEIKLDEYPGETFKGQIDEIARIQLQGAPAPLSRKAGGELNTETDETGQERPASASYPARVVLSDPQKRLVPGFRGRAKIQVGTRTAWRRFTRFLAGIIRIR
jgi:putative peptide zinc metalloprotease protein